MDGMESPLDRRGGIWGGNYLRGGDCLETNWATENWKTMEGEGSGEQREGEIEAKGGGEKGGGDKE